MDPLEPSIYSDGAVASGGSLLRCPFLHDLELPWAVPTAPPEVTAACPPEDQMTREQVWNVHPFGMPLLRHIVRAYEAIGDCQTLAALTCVLRMGEISELVPENADVLVDAPKDEGLVQARAPHMLALLLVEFFLSSRVCYAMLDCTLFHSDNPGA